MENNFDLINLYIQIRKNNTFYSINTKNGKNICYKSLGSLGYKNIKKRDQVILWSSLEKIFNIINLLKFKYIFIKFSGGSVFIYKNLFQRIVLFCKKYLYHIIGCSFLNSISHNGCRKKLK